MYEQGQGGWPKGLTVWMTRTVEVMQLQACTGSGQDHLFEAFAHHHAWRHHTNPEYVHNLASQSTQSQFPSLTKEHSRV